MSFNTNNQCSLKLKRPLIAKAYADEITQMYEEINTKPSSKL